MKRIHLYIAAVVIASSSVSACAGAVRSSDDEGAQGGRGGLGGSRGAPTAGLGGVDINAAPSRGGAKPHHGGADPCGGRSDGGGEPVGGAAGSAGAAGTAVEVLDLVSDGSWLTYGTNIGEEPPTGWNTLAFDDQSWTASIAPNPAACGSYEPTQSWERPNQPMWDVSNQYSAFFRKVVTLPESASVSAAKITSFADDDIAIWVNGSAVFVEPNFGVIEGGTIIPNEMDLKSFLVPGPNLIAIHAQDTIGFCRWAVVSGSIEVTRAAP